MKKYIIVLLTLLLCMGCTSQNPAPQKEEKTQTLLETYFDKKLYESECLYYNKDLYHSVDEAFLPEEVFLLKKGEVTFEGELEYDKVTYQEMTIEEKDKQYISDVAYKYNVLCDKVDVGIIFFISPTNIYVSNVDNDGNYTYICKLEEKTKKSEDKKKK